MVRCASPLASPIYTTMHILSNKNVGICPFATHHEHNLTELTQIASKSNVFQQKMPHRFNPLNPPYQGDFKRKHPSHITDIRILLQEICARTVPISEILKISLQHFPFSIAYSLVTLGGF